MNAAVQTCTCGTSLHKSSCPLFERFECRPSDFVGIAGPGLVFVGVKDRAKFDALALPVKDLGENANGHVLVKVQGDHQPGMVTVIFQHWIKTKTVMAMAADREEARAPHSLKVEREGSAS